MRRRSPNEARAGLDSRRARNIFDGNLRGGAARLLYTLVAATRKGQVARAAPQAVRDVATS
jgi:hypothetical protein